MVFLATHIIGLKEHGIKYIKHFTGPIWWLVPLMLPLEIIGHFARPLSLSLRLFGNMMGHERIVGVLLILMPLAYPMLAFSTVLGILVIFIQAFVFTLLAMMYIGGALEEAH
jgi:F-type H+-transporting ATPase subunit a